MSIAEESQLRENQEAHDGATTLTPSVVRAAKRKCPSIPSGFHEPILLLTRYAQAGEYFFTLNSQHFQEVRRMKQI